MLWVPPRLPPGKDKEARGTHSAGMQRAQDRGAKGSRDLLARCVAAEAREALHSEPELVQKAPRTALPAADSRPLRPAYPRTPRPTPARQICTSLNVAEIGAGGLSPSGLSIVPVKEDRQRSRGLAATFLAVLVRVSRLQAPVQGFHNGQWPGPNLNPVSQCPCQSWDHGPLYHLRLS